MNKRGFIRTLEAVIAIILIFLFIFFVGKGDGRADLELVQSVRSLQESVLDDISKKDNFRECIVATPVNIFNEVASGKNIEGGECVVEIRAFIANSLPNRFKEDHEFTVCDPEQLGTCTLPSISSQQVFTSAVIITSSLNSQQYKPRILRLWFF